MSKPARAAFAPSSDPHAVPYVRYENVSKHFGEVAAVRNVTLDIHKGEFFALLGPSGCGKTTLMRLLAGFERPDQGRLILDGEDVSAKPAHLRPVNMMFQSYALFPHLNVQDNIAFGLRQEGMPRRQTAERVAEMLALVKLEGYGRRRIDQLSGGQQQRVALARSLAKRPKVLVLDEPLAALDKKLREQTQYELMHLQGKLQTTFIIVTHDQDEAMTLASRIAVMDHGRIEQVGTPAEIYENPRSRHVAEFVGDVNILEGVVANVGSGQVIVEGTAAGRLHVHDARMQIESGERTYVAIRPEKMRLNTGVPESADYNAVQGEVMDIGYLGDMSVYHVRLANGAVLTASSANSARSTEREISCGELVWLSWGEKAGVLLKE